MVSPLLHKNEYGPVPPLTVRLTVPVAVPAQTTSVCVSLTVKADIGSVTMNV